MDALALLDQLEQKQKVVVNVPITDNLLNFQIAQIRDVNQNIVLRLFDAG